MSKKTVPENDVRGLFAANLKRARTNMRLSQLSLASKLGMAHNFINDIEHGRKWVSPETIQRLCSALEVKPYQFFIPDETDVIEKDRAVADCCEEISKATTEIIAKVRDKYLG